MVHAKKLVAAVLLLAAAYASQAQVTVNTNFPDASVIANSVQAPFNSTLTWVVGAIAVLAVIAWIRKGLKAR